MLGKARIGVCIYAQDMQKMVPFYRDILGFAADWDGGDFASFETASGDLSLFMYSRKAFMQALGQPYQAPGGVNPTFEVGVWLSSYAQVDQEYARLCRQEVCFPLGGPVTYPFGIRNFYVQDPEGNLLEIGARETPV